MVTFSIPGAYDGWALYEIRDVNASMVIETAKDIPSSLLSESRSDASRAGAGRGTANRLVGVLIR